ncbi:glycosyl hydrolase family 71-domain-containing protein [Naematelia encephala]|uniref:Glycosyl hydrolase family 71-domain-containing protein n=1 Tax=Naematelia encephala TaxID=71784 RepID=A0A1Y2ATQ4_9TREE|nr:glycosyl hydrolase family 71-domain-containing protein [Naematelia encephala]
MLSTPILVGLLVLGDIISASPTHARRSRRDHYNKRATCAAANTTSTSSASVDVSTSFTSAESTTSPDVAALAVGPDGHQGHWQVYTTSSWIDDESTSGASTSSAAGTASLSSTSSPATSPSGLNNDPNPITTFITSSSDDTSSVSVGLTVSVGGSDTSSASLTPSTTASSSGSTQTGSPGTGSSGDKRVFAHFMVGVVSTYKQGDWEADINLAKSKGIDGFALNIGVDPYTEAQLDLAYNAGDSIGFELFISFDFNWFNMSDVSTVAQLLSRYTGRQSQLLVDGKAFVSTFIGDGFDWVSVAAQVGKELYIVPFFQPTPENANSQALSGLFSWDAWPGQVGNQPVPANMTDDRDKLYLSLTGDASKTYMAPVSFAFFTHFGKEVSYSKNFMFYSDWLWVTRWEQILSLGDQLKFIEIVTWNDYGESHYIGPYNTPHTDDGSSKWAEGFDHTPVLDFAQPYIAAFKAGASEPIIDQEVALYYHRPHLKSAECDSTDNCGSKPTGWDYVEDAVFVATMTKSGGSVTITSGSNAPVQQTVKAGVDMVSVPMVPGQVSVQFTTTSGGSGSATSNITVSTECWNGIYNFNFNTGSIKV